MLIMPKEWQKDYYYKLAKSEDYRSRASFKLKQLNKRFGLIKKGNSVLDLGAAPGGWMKVAGELAGGKGFVLGVDIEHIEPFAEKNIVSIQADITKNETVEQIRKQGIEFDVVICDASPDISGVWDMDHFNSIYIARHALGIAKQVLKEGGNFLVKAFQGSLIKDYSLEVKREFDFIKTSKPKASRSRSSEVYLVCKGLLKTPVKYGDIIEIHATKNMEDGMVLAFFNGFKILVKDGQQDDKLKVRIKKVSKDLAWAEKI
jgi:23S rRNA (uridine2552-2'-O)-methyltransferase